MHELYIYSICKTLLTYDVVAIQLQFSLQRNSAREPQKQLIVTMVLTILTLTMLVTKGLHTYRCIHYCNLIMVANMYCREKQAADTVCIATVCS